MTKEQELFELVEKLEGEQLEGVGIHDTDFVDTRFPDEAQGYCIYHRDGYRFDITKEKEYENEEDEKGYWYYEFHEGVYDGFKDISIDEAIKLMKDAESRIL